MLMPKVDHIRVGFFDAESRLWPVDTKWGKGADRLAGYLWQASENERLDLVLGITPNGASYLLLPRAWVRSWNERAGGPAFSVRYPRNTEFLSLSPIHFIGMDSLSARLKSYEQRSDKKSGGKQDTSKANRPYFMSRATVQGQIRGDFENSRLFYSLFHSEDSQQLLPSFRQPGADLSQLSLETYAVHPRSAIFNARVLALSFSTITAGSAEDTQVLDVGWCDVFVRSNTTGGATNCQLYGQRMKVPRQRFSHDSVTSEMLSPSDIVARLQAIFGSAQPESPVVLLVHGVKNTCKQLDDLGFDTSRWRHGIQGVLYDGGLRGRERSRSPPRRGSSRPQSPPRPPAAVHVLDVEALVNCATNRGGLTASTNHTRVRRILENAARFGADVRGREITVPLNVHEPGGPTVKKTLYNAGHDSLLIAETWLALVDGADIDELSVTLGEDALIGHATEDTPPPEPEIQHELNDDDDPNIEPPTTGSHQLSAAKGVGMTELWDLSDEEADW
ncbi:hypothetical protein PENSPDRAFT_757948 [Peniophora sp. CONT]|nr:hypothetical protein PENSPDRAFT_757948 [Peniophora sp. CONT]